MDEPFDPGSGQRYAKFGDALEDAYEAITALVKSRKPADLAAEAYALFEQLRPAVRGGLGRRRYLEARYHTPARSLIRY